MSYRASTRVAVAACVIVSFSGAAVGQVEKRSFPGVQNFSRVDATIACAGATTPEAVAALKADGFTSIVNLRAGEEPGANVEAEAGAATKAGVQYFHLPFRAAAPDPRVVDRFLTVVSEPKNQPVFIHCATANRVAALWLIKRVRLDGWTIPKALEEATAIGLTSEPLRQFALDYLARPPAGR